MMDLGPFDGEEKAVSHSADDSHQDYAQGAAERARSGRRRVEVIIGGDRRRRWSPEDKARITAASFVPGANISAVARQYGVSQGLLHYWRRCARESLSDAEEMRFVPIVKVGDEQPQPSLGKTLTVRVEMNGACVVIEGGVDERTLRTVFSAIRGSA
jgi:transposase